MYEIIDASNCFNLRTLEYDNESRAKGVAGNISRALWRTDKIGLLRISQAAGVGTITQMDPVGFCYHSNCVEIEYLLDSICDLTYPDGTHVTLNPGDALVHQPGQPHGMQSLIPKNMQILAIYSCAPSSVDRFEFDKDTDKHANDKWKVARATDVPITPCEDPGVEIRILFENNEQPLSFAEITLKPGASIPLENFTTVNNCDEMVVVRSGKGIAIYPDKVYSLYRDITMYNYAGQPYKYVNIGNEDLHLLFTWSAYSYQDIERKIKKLEG